MYDRLLKEMSNAGISLSDISKTTGLRYQAVSRKINGHSDFWLQEAFLIQKKYFPQITVEDLFKKTDVVLSSKRG